MHWEEMHAGHYISRDAGLTQWDLNNAAVQCQRCNYGYNDTKTFNAREELAKHLRRRGVDTLNLALRSRKLADFTQEELQDKLDAFNEMLEVNGWEK